MNSAGFILRCVLAILIWLVVTIACASYFVWDWLNAPHSVNAEYQTIVLERGESLYSISSELNQAGLMRWPKVWVTYARLMELTDIKAGEYRLAEKESPISLLALFNSGKVVTYTLTFVEGMTAKNAVGVLAANQKLKATLSSDFNAQSTVIEGIDQPHLEGWFYPDTYQYLASDTDVSILHRAYKKMSVVLAEEWELRAENLPYTTPYEALIMASIVEKETGAPHEREQIAGVFVRRLNKGMRLQTDPTVIYGMGERYQGNITRKDLKTPTPYNTYTESGLPPTPIALPGRAAIHAALHPASGDTLYFVAQGDGTHYFSKTLEEHVEAVRRFQKLRKANYRSNYVDTTSQ